MSGAVEPALSRPKKQIGAQEIVIVALSSGIYAVLGIVSATFAIAPGGITLFYLPDAFMIPAALWFGVWGVLGAVFGTFLFSPFFGYGYVLGLAFAVVDVSSPLMAGLILKKLKIDPALRDKRSLLYYFFFGVIINSAVEAILGGLVMYKAGWYSLQAAPWGAFIWWTGCVGSTLIIAPVLLRALTPFFRRTGLFHETFFGGRTGAVIED